MKTIKLKDVGPVKNLEIGLPDGGGVIVLTGRNGAGKSESLKAIDSLITGKEPPTTRDGAAGRGEIEGWGAKLILGKRTDRKGALNVISLEGKLDVSVLVDPKIKDPVAADKHRIKALISVTGVQADPALFAPIMGTDGEYLSHVNESSLQMTDLIDMAAKIKLDLEAAARDAEALAQHKRGEVAGAKQAIEGINLNAPCDEQVLAKALTDATANAQALRTQQKQAAEQAAKIAAAKKTFDELNAANTITLEQAQADAKVARKVADDFLANREKCRAAVEAAKLAFDQAEAALKVAQADVIVADDQVANIQRRESMIASVKAAMSATAIESPTADAIADADVDVQIANAAVGAGAVVRNAKAKAAAIGQLEQVAEQAEKNAIAIRKAATDGVDTVLSDAIKVPDLYVKGGRIYTTTERGETLFSELSEGQRWKIALELAAMTVGDGGVIVVQQPAWEGLDDDNRNLISKIAKNLKVIILTAEATRGPITTKIFEGN